VTRGPIGGGGKVHRAGKRHDAPTPIRHTIAFLLPVATAAFLVYLLGTPEYEDPTRAWLQDQHHRPWWEIGGFLALSTGLGLVGMHGISEGSRKETAAGAILIAFLLPYWPFGSIWSLVIGIPLLVGVLLVGTGD
jgi:hypothetical protein